MTNDRHAEQAWREGIENAVRAPAGWMKPSTCVRKPRSLWQRLFGITRGGRHG